MDLGIKNKVAFVTGGSRGLGKAAAISLAKEGVNIGICGRTQSSINSTIDDFGKYRLNNGSSLLLSKTDKPTFTKDKNIEVIDYEKVKNKNLKVRSWVYGDSFQPLGMHGKKKVSDFLIDNKIDCFEKQSQLVLTANDDIIWLCGQRISDKVKVTKNTSTMMELSYEKYVEL